MEKLFSIFVLLIVFQPYFAKALYQESFKSEKGFFSPPDPKFFISKKEANSSNAHKGSLLISPLKNKFFGEIKFSISEGMIF